MFLRLDNFKCVLALLFAELPGKTLSLEPQLLPPVPGLWWEVRREAPSQSATCTPTSDHQVPSLGLECEQLFGGPLCSWAPLRGAGLPHLACFARLWLWKERRMKEKEPGPVP